MVFSPPSRLTRFPHVLRVPSFQPPGNRSGHGSHSSSAPDTVSPCFTLSILPSFPLPGDRSGHILLWDTGSGGVSWRIKNVHVGHVTALAWFDPAGSRGSGADADGGGGGPHAGCFVSGGQDGVVRVWDARARYGHAQDTMLA